MRPAATWPFSPIKFHADMGILRGFMFRLDMLGALILRLRSPTSC